ncbi:MAG: hypothetical protein WBE76_19115 [Terracidiphilus sp.]
MAKANRAASLVRYAKVHGLGWFRGSLIHSKNGRIKDGYMMVNGVERHAPNGQYQIRTYDGSKAKYTSVGNDLEQAQALLQRYLNTREHERLESELGIKLAQPQAQERKTLTEVVTEYIVRKKAPSLNLSETSIRHYEDTLPEFARACGCRFLDEVTEAAVAAYMDSLIARGYAPKTRVMRYTCVRGFLRSCGVVVEKLIDGSTHKR